MSEINNSSKEISVAGDATVEIDDGIPKFVKELKFKYPRITQANSNKESF